MKRKTKKILKTVLPLALGVFLIWYSLSSATPDERLELWNNILRADPSWVLLSLLFGILSHLSRAYRWKFLLEPLGCRPKFTNSFMCVMAGYLANLGVPRSGEVLRGATFSSYEDISFDKAFGTIVSERIADLFMLLIIVFFGLLIQTDSLLNYFTSHDINPLLTIAFFFGLVIFGIIFLRLLKISKIPLLLKVKKFAKGLLEGMRSILKMKRKGAFIFHTVFIWVMYLLMFYIIKFSIPETSNLGLDAILAGFMVGTFAISTTNGGIGVYPVAIGAVLLYFGVDHQAGKAFGWIIWTSQTLLVIVLGGLSFLLLPAFNRRKI